MASALQMVERLRGDTRFHQCVADADRLALAEHEGTYLAYLERAYGFEAPVESALAVAPGLADLIDLGAYRSSSMLARELGLLGVAPERLLEIDHCRVAPFRELSTALGWLFVAQMNRASHALLRTYSTRKNSDLAEELAWDARERDRERWDELDDLLARVGRDAGSAQAIADAAAIAYDTQHYWFRSHAPSGTALGTMLRFAQAQLRARRQRAAMARA